MTMFTRLKNRPSETIMFFVTFNLVAVILIAIKAVSFSPEILVFSTLAAVTAIGTIVMLAYKIDAPLKRLARAVDTPLDQRSASEGQSELGRRDEIGQLARALLAPRAAESAEREQQAQTLRRMDETLRRMSNGDLTCQIQEEFDGPLEGLKVRINRLGSMLSVNLLAMRENSALLKEQARTSQGDLSIIGGRISHAVPTARKASSAVDVLHRASRLRHDDAQLIVRHIDGASGADVRLNEAAGAVLSSGQAASRSLDAMTGLAHAVGDLAIKAESLSCLLRDRATDAARDAQSSDPAALTRALADDSMKAAQDLMRQIRETELSVSESIRVAHRMERTASSVGETLVALHEPAERLARNADLEMQRLSLAHLAAVETENVLVRSLDIVQATEGAVIRMMGEASAVETRLAAFQFASPAQGVRPLAGEKPNLRCIT